MGFETPNIYEKAKSGAKKVTIGALFVGAVGAGAEAITSSGTEKNEKDSIELSNIEAKNTFDKSGVESKTNIFEADVPAGIEKIYFYPGDGSRREISIQNGKFEFPGMGGNVTGVDVEGNEHYLTFEQ